MMRIARGRAIAAALLAAAASPVLLPATAGAQSQGQQAETIDQKVRRMDAEIKALQRKVFPDAGSKFFTPEITPGTPATAAQPMGTPASGPVSDLLARMDSLEGQVTRLTAQVEESQNRIAKLEAALAALQPAPAGADPAGPTPPAPAPAAGPKNGQTIDTNTAAMTGGASAKPAPAPAAKPAQAPASRVAAVQAIEKPQTADRGDDEYTYGFRLWSAKFYPEAQQQLTAYIQQYPRHAKVSHARNLLGRAYLDDGMPGAAAKAFLENYQSNPRGERAPDSLLYLALATERLDGGHAKACVALQQLGEEYPQVVAGRLAGETARVRAAVKCN